MSTSLPYISQVYIMFIGKAENDFSPGIESLETQLFTEAEIPWDDLAFPVIKQTLDNFFADRKKLKSQSNQNILSTEDIATFPMHNLTIQRR